MTTAQNTRALRWTLVLLAACIGMLVLAFNASTDVSPELPQPVAKKYYKLWFKNSAPPEPVHQDLNWWPELKTFTKKMATPPFGLTASHSTGPVNYSEHSFGKLFPTAINFRDTTTKPLKRD